MVIRKILLYTFIPLGITTICFFSGSAVIFMRSYSDPRWRVFDYNSHQATEGNIYNVAEIPAITSVSQPYKRLLRFSFTINATTWTVRSQSDNHIVSEGKYPEIQFSDEPYTDTFHFIPNDITLNKDIFIKISYYPKEGYEEFNLSWPDNYYSPRSSVPFSLKQPYSLDEWAGLPENDPECIEARGILGNTIKTNMSSLEKSEKIFRFIMHRIKDSSGIPSDDMQNASPLETYKLLSTGKGKGWCENKALVYYLFANAAGVKTRVVDIAGKFGPLKLTGHYFCESWDTEQHRWYFVDPQSNTAHIQTAQGRLLNTLEIKRLKDMGIFDGYSKLSYDENSGLLISENLEKFMGGTGNYFNNEIVLAYKFGYPKNRTYSKLKHFLHYPTLLYAPFYFPNRYIIKIICLWGFFLNLLFTLLVGLCLIVCKKTKGAK